jgi:hypothetical protein
VDNLKQLQEMKSALERQIAEAIEAERMRQRAIEEQQARLRDAEIEKVRGDISMLMRKYDLTREELLGDPVVPSKNSLHKTSLMPRKSERSQSLRDIRTYYTKSAKL